MLSPYEGLVDLDEREENRATVFVYPQAKAHFQSRRPSTANLKSVFSCPGKKLCRPTLYWECKSWIAVGDFWFVFLFGDR